MKMQDKDLHFPIPTGVPITVANDAIEMLSLVVIKQLKNIKNNQSK